MTNGKVDNPGREVSYGKLEREREPSLTHFKNRNWGTKKGGKDRVESRSKRSAI